MPPGREAEAAVTVFFRWQCAARDPRSPGKTRQRQRVPVMRGWTRTVGRSAEKLALAHLRRHGLRHVDSNYRTRRGEIDLVMLDDGCLVFVEVRYRARTNFGSAAETVDRHKRARLAAAAAKYLAAHEAFRYHTCRFDVVGIERDATGDTRIDWRRDAFRLTDDG